MSIQFAAHWKLVSCQSPSDCSDPARFRQSPRNGEIQRLIRKGAIWGPLETTTVGEPQLDPRVSRVEFRLIGISIEQIVQF